MNDVRDCLEKLAGHRVTPRPGDYTDSDGCLVCGKCHKRRETLIRWMADDEGNREIRKVPVMCDCEQQQADQEKLEDERKQKSYRITQLQSYGFSPGQLEGLTFANCDWQGEHTRLAWNYFRHFDEMKAAGAGLLFYGNVGTGKTFLAGCIVNALQAQFRTAFMTTFARLDRELSSWANKDDKTAALDRITNCELLVIDDLGIEQKNPRILETEFQVIDARARVKRPMIITTNLSPTDFGAEDWGYRRIYDRIIGCCKPVCFTGKSRRRRAQEKDKWARIDELLQG